jgi:hypothetical protein
LQDIVEEAVAQLHQLATAAAAAGKGNTLQQLAATERHQHQQQH